VAAGAHADLPTAMAAMSHRGDEIRPDTRTRAFHAAKHDVVRDMHRNQLRFRARIRAAIPQEDAPP